MARGAGDVRLAPDDKTIQSSKSSLGVGMTIGATAIRDIAPRARIYQAARSSGKDSLACRHDRAMQLPSALAWLVDEAGASPGPDRFLAELGAPAARPTACRSPAAR